MNKLCTLCNEIKSISSFYKCSGNKDGLQSYCKMCMKKYRSSHGDKNSEKIKEYKKQYELKNNYNKKYYENNKNKMAILFLRNRAKRFNAFIEDIDPNILYERDFGECGICELLIDKLFKFPHPMSLSVDHIIPLSNGGKHSYNNTRIAHLICNRKNFSFPVKERRK